MSVSVPEYLQVSIVYIKHDNKEAGTEIGGELSRHQRVMTGKTDGRVRYIFVLLLCQFLSQQCTGENYDTSKYYATGLNKLNNAKSLQQRFLNTGQHKTDGEQVPNRDNDDTANKDKQGVVNILAPSDHGTVNQIGPLQFFQDNLASGGEPKSYSLIGRENVANETTLAELLNKFTRGLKDNAGGFFSKDDTKPIAEKRVDDTVVFKGAADYGVMTVNKLTRGLNDDAGGFFSKDDTKPIAEKRGDDTVVFKGAADYGVTTLNKFTRGLNDNAGGFFSKDDTKPIADKRGDDTVVFKGADNYGVMTRMFPDDEINVRPSKKIQPDLVFDRPMHVTGSKPLSHRETTRPKHVYNNFEKVQMGNSVTDEIEILLRNIWSEIKKITQQRQHRDGLHFSPAYYRVKYTKSSGLNDLPGNYHRKIDGNESPRQIEPQDDDEDGITNRIPALTGRYKSYRRNLPSRLRKLPIEEAVPDAQDDVPDTLPKRFRGMMRGEKRMLRRKESDPHSRDSTHKIRTNFKHENEYRPEQSNTKDSYGHSRYSDSRITRPDGSSPRVRTNVEFKGDYDKRGMLMSILLKYTPFLGKYEKFLHRAYKYDQYLSEWSTKHPRFEIQNTLDVLKTLITLMRKVAQFKIQLINKAKSYSSHQQDSVEQITDIIGDVAVFNLNTFIRQTNGIAPCFSMICTERVKHKLSDHQTSTLYQSLARLRERMYLGPGRVYDNPHTHSSLPKKYQPHKRPSSEKTAMAYPPYEEQERKEERVNSEPHPENISPPVDIESKRHIMDGYEPLFILDDETAQKFGLSYGKGESKEADTDNKNETGRDNSETEEEIKPVTLQWSPNAFKDSEYPVKRVKRAVYSQNIQKPNYSYQSMTNTGKNPGRASYQYQASTGGGNNKNPSSYSYQNTVRTNGGKPVAYSYQSSSGNAGKNPGYSYQSSSSNAGKNPGYSYQSSSSNTGKNPGYSYQSSSSNTGKNPGYSYQSSSSNTGRNPGYSYQSSSNNAGKNQGSYGYQSSSSNAGKNQGYSYQSGTGATKKNPGNYQTQGSSTGKNYPPNRNNGFSMGMMTPMPPMKPFRSLFAPMKPMSFGNMFGKKRRENNEEDSFSSENYSPDEAMKAVWNQNDQNLRSIQQQSSLPGMSNFGSFTAMNSPDMDANFDQLSVRSDGELADNTEQPTLDKFGILSKSMKPFRRPMDKYETLDNAAASNAKRSIQESDMPVIDVTPRGFGLANHGSMSPNLENYGDLARRTYPREFQDRYQSAQSNHPHQKSERKSNSNSNNLNSDVMHNVRPTNNYGTFTPNYFEGSRRKSTNNYDRSMPQLQYFGSDATHPRGRYELSNPDYNTRWESRRHGAQEIQNVGTSHIDAFPNHSDHGEERDQMEFSIANNNGGPNRSWQHPYGILQPQDRPRNLIRRPTEDDHMYSGPDNSYYKWLERGSDARDITLMERMDPETFLDKHRDEDMEDPIVYRHKTKKEPWKGLEAQKENESRRRGW